MTRRATDSTASDFVRHHELTRDPARPAGPMVKESGIMIVLPILGFFEA